MSFVLLFSTADATVFRIDFYSELSRSFFVGTDEYFDRTFATGDFLFDDAIGFVNINPITHL